MSLASTNPPFALSVPGPSAELQQQGVFAAWALALCFGLVYSNTLVIAARFHGLPTAVAYFAPVTLAAIGAIAVLRLRYSVQLTAAFPWLSLMLLSGVLGTVLARSPALALETLTEFLVEGFALYLLVANAVRNTRSLNYCVWAIIVAATGMALVVLHQLVTSNYASNYGGFAQVGSHLATIDDDTPSRHAGAIGEVNRFAQVLAMALPLALVKARVEHSRRVRLLVAAAAVIILAGCMATYSRGVLVGLLPLAVVALYLGYVRVSHLLLGALVIVAFAATDPNYRKRMLSIVDLSSVVTSGDGIRNSDGAIRGRYTSIGASVLVYLDHPIVGAGPGMGKHYYTQYSRHVGGKVRNYPRETHSLLPQIAAEWGTLGLIGFLGAVTTVILGLLRKIRQLRARGDWHEHLPAALLLTVVVYAGTSVFLHFSYIRFFWLILGLAAAAAAIRGQPASVHSIAANAPAHSPSASSSSRGKP